MRTGRNIFKRLAAVILTTMLIASMCPVVVNAAGFSYLRDTATRILPNEDWYYPNMLYYSEADEYVYYKVYFPAAGNYYLCIKAYDDDVIIYSSFFYENAETMGEEAQYQRIGAYSGPHEKGWYYIRLKCSDPCDISIDINSSTFGWHYDDVGFWYRDLDGTYPANKWKCIKAHWYYFDASGYLVRGWKRIDGKWYYFSGSPGYAITGWYYISGWYYFDKTSCEMKTGWIYHNGYWYYMKPNGLMAESEYWDGYWLGSTGKWTYQHRAQWHDDGNDKWWYGDDTGWRAGNMDLKINGKIYTFDSQGYCVNPYSPRIA